MDQATICGLILCGGAGSRLGGKDKGLVSFHGKPLVDIAIERLSPQVSEILISANRNISAYQQRGFEVLKDAEFQDDGPNYEGPLAGILQGLRTSKHPWLAVIPCDCPMFPLDLVQRLCALSAKTQRASFVAGHQSFSLLPQSSHTHLAQALQHGKRKLSDWLLSIGGEAVEFDDAGFKNLNTPQDF